MAQIIQAMDLSAGKYDLICAVRDDLTGQATIARAPFELH